MKKGIIFDFDGVLIDYSYRFHKTYEDVLLKFNIPCPTRKEIMNIKRQTNDSQIKLLDSFLVPKDAYNRNDIIKTCAEKRLGIIETRGYLKLDRFYSGVFDIVNEYRNNNFKTGLITKRKSRKLFLKQLGDNSINFDFIENTQDKEDSILRFISQYKTKENYFITDTSNDVMIGKKVGVVVIGVLTGLENKNLLKKAGSDFIINKMKDIVNIVK